MAKNTIADLDTTAANNTDVLNQSTLGTASVSTIDTMIQNTLGLLARFYADIGGTGTVGGSANALTLTTASTYQALATGIFVSFKATSANTAAATLNVDALGAKAIRRRGDSALQAGDIAANGIYLLRYDSAYNSAAGAWVLLNPEYAAVPFTAASASESAYIDLAEDTDNGTNKVKLQAPASLGSDVTVTLPNAAGTLPLDTLGQGQHTFFVPAGAMTPASTNGAARSTAETTTHKVMRSTLDFDASTEEFAQFFVQMPKSWNEGTLVAQFIWSHPSTSTNFGVVWGIEAVALADDDALDTAWGTEIATTDTGGTTDDIYITAESSAITVAGSPGNEEFVLFRVTRVVGNGSDTMAVDARLHGVKIHYTTNAATDD